MRVVPNAACDKDFILQGIIENCRTDFRKCTEYRPVSIALGKQRGTCFVELGDTKVFACISAEIVIPKSGRPYSGVLQINVDMSPMAAPNFESGRLGNRGVEISRIVERVLKESNCLDLESLCIIANERVWQIRADIHVIDNDGSLVDCASIAVICALKSFRRPDVTISGESFVVHSLEERKPVPLSLYHMPVCITFGLSEDGNCITVDPTDREQSALEGEIVIAMNSHKELCTMHCSTSSLIKDAQVSRCLSMAAQRSKEISDIIKSTFETDTLDRSNKRKLGFSVLVRPTKQLTSKLRIADITENLEIPKVSSKFVTPAVSTTNQSLSPERPKKSVLLKTAQASPRLMTQRETLNEEDETNIVDEILNVRLTESTTTTSTKQDTTYGEDELEITAIRTKKETRRRRPKKRDDGVAQLLMDIEDDSRAPSFSNAIEEDVEIVQVVSKNKRSKKASRD